MWSCRRLVSVALPAASGCSGLPWSSWKNQSGVCWYQTSVCPYTRILLSRAKFMMAIASELGRKAWVVASYHWPGLKWFSGVTWSKCLSSSCDGLPTVSRLSIATPIGKSTVSLIGVRSWIGLVSVVIRMSSTRYVYGTFGSRLAVPMYTWSVVGSVPAGAVPGAVHCALTVVHAPAVIVVLPIHSNCGFITKRTPADPAVPSASRTFIEKVYVLPAWNRPVGLWMPTKSWARLLTLSTLPPSGPSTTVSVLESPPLCVQVPVVPFSKSTLLTVVTCGPTGGPEMRSEERRVGK